MIISRDNLKEGRLVSNNCLCDDRIAHFTGNKKRRHGEIYYEVTKASKTSSKKNEHCKNRRRSRSVVKSSWFYRELGKSCCQGCVLGGLHHIANSWCLRSMCTDIIKMSAAKSKPKSVSLIFSRIFSRLRAT